MPVLHKYVNIDRFYVLTSINGKIITFQISSEGERKLRATGIESGKTFRRALLLDLYKSGDAYTHGSGPGTVGPVVDPRQMQLDFTNDPEPETMFPACALCSSIDDLHLVEIKDIDHYASLLCQKCRAKASSTINTSLPLPLVTRSILSRLLEMNQIPNVDDSVTAYRNVLDQEFSAKWAAIAKDGKKQQLDFGISDGKQGKLI
jgi:hypothetical protein